MTRLLDRLLFPPAPPTRPALLRLLVGGYCLWYLGSRWRLFGRIAETDPALFRPVGLAAPLRRPLPVRVVRAILAATLAANVAFLLGWRYRASGPAFSGLLLWTLTYRNSWSMIYHSDNALVLHALILGVSPAADALSLDARGRDGRPGEAWRYGWPVALMNVATALTYLVAGVAKVVGPLGWGWASGSVLRDQVAVDGVRKDLLGERARPLAFLLHDKLALYRVLAVGSLLIELGAPLAPLDRRLGRAWALATWLLHWGILLVMGIKFRYQLSGLIFAPFFELERGVERLALVAGRGVR